MQFITKEDDTKVYRNIELYVNGDFDTSITTIKTITNLKKTFHKWSRKQDNPIIITTVPLHVVNQVLRYCLAIITRNAYKIDVSKISITLKKSVKEIVDSMQESYFKILKKIATTTNSHLGNIIALDFNIRKKQQQKKDEWLFIINDIETLNQNSNKLPKNNSISLIDLLLEDEYQEKYISCRGTFFDLNSNTWFKKYFNQE